MTLRSDYHIVLGHKLNGPTEMSVDPYYIHERERRASHSRIPPVVVHVQKWSCGQTILAASHRSLHYSHSGSM
jgi:hypothetical protein